MRIVMCAPSVAWPVGGINACYEWADGLACRGHDVTVAHVGFGAWESPSVDKLTWHKFHADIRHVYGFQNIPDADKIIVADQRRPHGETVGLVQGYRGFDPAVDDAIVNAPHLKLATSRWLYEMVEQDGTPPVGLLPYGIWHHRWPQHTPWKDRRPMVAFLSNNHPLKGTKIAVRALGLVRQQRPDVRVLAVGTSQPGPFPRWVRYLENPTHKQLVSVYNRARVWIQASVWEGFGLMPIEAMCSGAALVTTDCGGSRDYAHPETARIVAQGDIPALAQAIIETLEVGEQLSVAGREFVQRYRWDTAAEILERHLS